jgi:hypothetical protein
MTRVGHALLTFVGGACLAVGCSASPRDQNFNTDAEANFVPPPPTPDTGVDDTATGDAGANAGTGGAAGAGGTAGAEGTGTTSSDADTDAASDGGTP